MRLKGIISTGVIILIAAKTASAGEFYKIYPTWLEFGYHIFLVVFSAASLLYCYSIYGNLRGGRLGLPWIFILLALVAMLARTAMGILTVFDVAFFQAIVFAGLDALFITLLLIGLIIYKTGLN
jgi:hypothetical protein